MLYRGAFLSGFYLKDSSTLEDWQLREEKSLRLERLFVLQRLVEMHSSAGEYKRALEGVSVGPRQRRTLRNSPTSGALNGALTPCRARRDRRRGLHLRASGRASRSSS